MYTLPNKLKVFALVFMVLGAIGIVAGFLSAPKTTEEVAAMMAEAHHGEGHAAQTHDMDGHATGHNAQEHGSEMHASAEHD